MPRKLAWRRTGLGHACQSGNKIIAISLTMPNCFSCLKFRFCLSTVSTIMIILQSGALGCNVIGVSLDISESLALNT